jgi:hypothetical protein
MLMVRLIFLILRGVDFLSVVPSCDACICRLRCDRLKCHFRRCGLCGFPLWFGKGGWYCSRCKV